MTNTLPPIVFFGTDEFSLTTLTGLLEAGHPVVAVVTKPDTRAGRGQKVTPPPVKVLATSYNIPVWQPEKLRDITPAIQLLKNPIGILSSYGKIIPQRTIDLFKPGIINIHPSLLPLYRGSSPIETAIANGDNKTGVSIMQLSAEMDAGPVYVAKEYPLSGNETKPALYQELATLGTNLLLETLPQIANDELVPNPQNEAHATYTSMLTKEDAWLQPEAATAAEAERRVRAHLGFPRTKVTLYDHTLIITKAHTETRASTPLSLPCKDGNYLTIDELIAPSGRLMNVESFARGYLRSR